MTDPTIRNLPDDARRGLDGGGPLEGGVGLGSALAEAGRQAALTDEEWAVFVSRDKAPGRPVSLG